MTGFDMLPKVIGMKSIDQAIDAMEFLEARPFWENPQWGNDPQLVWNKGPVFDYRDAEQVERLREWQRGKE